MESRFTKLATMGDMIETDVKVPVQFLSKSSEFSLSGIVSAIKTMYTAK